MTARAVQTPVNTASVTHRSPFRYPGGKTWLVPHVRRWLQSRPKPTVFVEPFCGGASVGLAVAAEELACRVVLCELDACVAAVWRVIVTGDAEALARKIESYELTRDNVMADLGRQPDTDVEWAFQTILRNRVQRGGVMAKRAGLMRAGERGRGIASRWYPGTLARRIRQIGEYRDRIEFIEGDAFSVIATHRQDPEAAYFIDPPYTAGGSRAGARLYTHWELDHHRLFAEAAAVCGGILMTYDDTPEVWGLAEDVDFEVAPVAMWSNHNGRRRELLIGRDLSWLD